MSDESLKARSYRSMMCAGASPSRGCCPSASRPSQISRSCATAGVWVLPLAATPWPARDQDPRKARGVSDLGQAMSGTMILTLSWVPAGSGLFAWLDWRPAGGVPGLLWSNCSNIGGRHPIDGDGNMNIDQADFSILLSESSMANGDLMLRVGAPPPLHSARTSPG
jgi:hypothetical protein